MGLFGPPDVAKLEAKRDVPGLIKALGYKKDSSVRGLAAIALGRLGDARAVEPLVASLEDYNGWVAERAARALGEIGDPRAVEPLIAALGKSFTEGRRPTSPTEGVRDNVAWALGEIGDPRAVEPLIRATADFYSSVCSSAIMALGAIADPRAVERLIELLGDSNRDFRKAAVEALGRIGPIAIPGLVAALASPAKEKRRAAADSLAMLGWQPDATEAGASYWIAKLPDQGAADTLVKIGVPAVKPLVAALPRLDGFARLQAGRVLRKLGDARAAGAFVASLADRDPAVRGQAASVLSPDDGRADASSGLWAETREWAGQIRPVGPAVGHLIGALADGSWHVRRTAAEGLVALHQLGRLDEAQRAKVLAQRGTITRPHEASISWGGNCTGIGWEVHADEGIGVEFPV